MLEHAGLLLGSVLTVGPLTAVWLDAQVNPLMLDQFGMGPECSVAQWLEWTLKWFVGSS